MVVLNIFLLIVGFVMLIKGADFFVDGASAIAANLKISKMLIALTIVSFGTSAPELAVAVKAIASGSGDIILGNVIGSNTLNILLIVGVSAVVHSLGVKNNTVKKELPITMLITTLFGVLLLDNIFDKGMANNFSRSDGIVLLLFFSVFMYYLISMSRNKIDEDEVSPMPILKAIGFTILGLAGIVLGSNFVVDSASYLAKAIGISERIIALTVIAFGTSLPELVTSVSATRKGEYDIAIGNVVGSNIFNIGIVLGIPVAIFGGVGRISFSIIDILVMVVTAILLFVFSLNDRKISKSEGIIFLIIFVVYYGYILIG
ncbi:MAG: calcium/sodium antiporter [Bacilli bacterium]|nr:calcium/sodium antiporter [Bacilli bacterium]